MLPAILGVFGKGFAFYVPLSLRVDVQNESFKVPKSTPKVTNTVSQVCHFDIISQRKNFYRMTGKIKIFMQSLCKKV